MVSNVAFVDPSRWSQNGETVASSIWSEDFPAINIDTKCKSIWTLIVFPRQIIRHGWINNVRHRSIIRSIK